VCQLERVLGVNSATYTTSRIVFTFYEKKRRTRGKATMSQTLSIYYPSPTLEPA